MVDGEGKAKGIGTVANQTLGQLLCRKINLTGDLVECQRATWQMAGQAHGKFGALQRQASLLRGEQQSPAEPAEPTEPSDAQPPGLLRGSGLCVEPDVVKLQIESEPLNSLGCREVGCIGDVALPLQTHRTHLALQCGQRDHPAQKRGERLGGDRQGFEDQVVVGKGEGQVVKCELSPLRAGLRIIFPREFCLMNRPGTLQ